jgi:glutaminase
METEVENSARKKNRTKTPAPAKAAFEDVETQDQQLFDSLDVDSDGIISKQDLFSKLQESGILNDDPRIQDTVESIKKLHDTVTLENRGRIDGHQFKAVTRHNRSLIRNAITGNLAVPDFKSLCADLTEIFDLVKENREGQVASYIPQLGRVNPEQFAVTVCTVDGQRFSLGEADVPFCVQSVSKPISYCLALEEHGENTVHRHMGRESSGRRFNELTLNDAGLPHNPMINAGAIMSCSLLKPNFELADRFDYVLNTWQRLAGKRRVGFNNSVYLSERQTADRNFALCYFMREKKAFPAGTDIIQALEFYFQCCSIDIDANGLSIVAASLANAGICPTTGEVILSAHHVQNCLSLMSSCGMYDFSGEFAFSIGLPAKSGVSGALMVVIPRVMGVAIWSPRLDALGNSIRGIEFCRHLVKRYNFHAYDIMTSGSSGKRDPRLKKNQELLEGVVNLCWAASQGDLGEVQRLAACGVDLNGADYDGRTAIHIAASEGHTHVVQFLIAKGVHVSPQDRWNGTPLADARRGNHAAVIKVLEECARHGRET